MNDRLRALAEGEKLSAKTASVNVPYAMHAS